MAKLPRGKVKMYEIAMAAGVSPSAVSRYINGNGPLSAALRQRIEAAIQSLDFVTDAEHASRFPRRKVFGILLPIHMGLQYFSDVDALFELYADWAGYHTMSLRPDFSKHSLTEILQDACSERIAGLFVPSLPHTRLTEQEVQLIAEHPTPILFLSEFEQHYPTLNCILIDNAGATAQAVCHLMQVGCRQLALLTPPCVVNKAAAQRARGFLEATERQGLQQAAALVCEEPFDGPMAPILGYRAAKKAFDRNPKLDGLLCWNDVLAAGALWYLAERGLRIPQDVKVVTFNDEYARMLCPPLTAFPLPTEQIAKLAVEQLCRLQDATERMITRQLPVTLSLIARTSTAADGRVVPPDH